VQASDYSASRGTMHATPIKVSTFYDVNDFPRLRAAVSRRGQVIDSKLKECRYYVRGTMSLIVPASCLLITTRDNAAVLPLRSEGYHARVITRS